MAGVDFRNMLKAESGSKQKNADGSVVRSPKGAVGIAQVMPATGPEAAKLAGLKWDPRRFEQDGEYNRQLGQAYHDEQTRKFGRRGGIAAYNAGPGRVAELKKKHGADWEAHLPAETKGYLAKVTGTQVMKTVDPGASSAPQQHDPLAQAAESMGNAFTITPEIQARHKTVIETGNKAMDTLTQATSQLDQIQLDREAELAASVSAKSAIYDDIANQTEELKTKIAPIFAQRGELAKRRLELENMNPIKRDILSIFNRNYSKDHIDAQDQALASQAALTGEEYEVTTKLQNTMLNVITGQYSGRDAIATLTAANLGQDIELAQNSLGLARQQFGDAIAGVQATTQITQAQLVARNDTLSQMTLSDLNTAMAQAKKGGGSTVINGVTLSQAEIDDRIQKQQQQDISLETAIMARDQQKIHVQQAAETRLISHMNTSEIQQAIKAGGEFRGVKLDQVQLTQALGSSMQRTEMMVTQASGDMSAPLTVRTLQSMNDVIQGTAQRMQGLTGARVPAEYRGFNQRMVQIGNAYTEKMRGASPEVQGRLRQAMVSDLSKMMQDQDKVIDKVAQGMSRDPDAQILLGSWLKGNTPTPEQATKGIIALSRGGALPPGVKLQGPAAAAVRAGLAAAANVDKRYDENNPANREAIMRGQFKKPNKQALEAERMAAVSKATSGAWIKGNMSQMMSALPAAAARAGDPFGQVSPADFRAAQAAGDRAGMERLSQRLGWSVEQTAAVFGAGGKGKAGFESDKLSYEQARRALDTDQNTEFLRALDRSPSAGKMQVKPSEAMVNFMTSPTMQKNLANYGSVVGQGDFGSMVGDSISGGGLNEFFNQYASGLGKAQGAIHLEDTEGTRQQAANYAGSPFKRAAVIAGAIPGLDPTSEKLLLQGLKDEMGFNGTLATLPVVGAGGEAVSSRIDQVILHGKFEDPKLEKIRRVAAQHWADFSSSTDRAVARLRDSSEQ